MTKYIQYPAQISTLSKSTTQPKTVKTPPTAKGNLRSRAITPKATLQETKEGSSTLEKVLMAGLILSSLILPTMAMAIRGKLISPVSIKEQAQPNSSLQIFLQDSVDLSNPIKETNIPYFNPSNLTSSNISWGQLCFNNIPPLESYLPDGTDGSAAPFVFENAKDNSTIEQDSYPMCALLEKVDDIESLNQEILSEPFIENEDRPSSPNYSNVINDEKKSEKPSQNNPVEKETEPVKTPNEFQAPTTSRFDTLRILIAITTVFTAWSNPQSVLNKDFRSFL